MTDDDRRTADASGASAPEPSLVARQARATMPGVTGDLTESPDDDAPASSDRVDARAATLGSALGEADPGEETATTGGTTADAPQRLTTTR
jgi:hypothetical protein